jgi:hypothetical protein
MVHFVGFDNHLPRLPAEASLDHEAPLDEVAAKP